MIEYDCFSLFCPLGTRSGFSFSMPFRGCFWEHWIPGGPSSSREVVRSPDPPSREALPSLASNFFFPPPSSSLFFFPLGESALRAYFLLSFEACLTG